MVGQEKPPSFYKRLSSGLVSSPLNSKEFLQLDFLDNEITKENVEAQVPSKFLDWLRSNIHDRIVQNAKRVFAILLLMDETSAIRSLLADGLTDNELPLFPETAQGSDNTLVSFDGRHFPSFRRWKESRVNDFLAKQWLVLAPVFDTSGRHFALNPQCAMPFIASDEISGGAFSFVHKCELHRAHMKGFDTKDGNIQTAVKQFKVNKLKSISDAFDQDKQNLEQLRSLNHRHMIRYYATCEVKSTNNYYVIFPWADGGNLWEYWKRDCSNNVNETWVFAQILGLTEAVAALHGRGVRHGDLKPDNILLFNSASDPTLVIGDVGISRFHREDTFLRVGKTTPAATTLSYQAPEVFEKPNAPRSRSYDTWSLGCIFLEFAIWYLFDFNAVMAFQSARESGRAAYDNPGYFYKQMDDRSVAAHSQVTEAISFLLEDPRCSPGTSFESLIRLISDGLLQLDFKQRPKADAVVTRLQEIVSRMVGSKSLAKNRVAMSKPFVFQQQTSKHGPKDSVMNTSTFA